MSEDFMTRVVRMRKKGVGLDHLERSGDSMMIAASLADLNPTFEKWEIGVPRASSLYSACMRQRVIGTEYEREQPQWANFKSKVTFGIGSAVHFWLQNTPDLLGENRFGWWRCWACGRIRYFGGPSKKPCENCGARAAASFYYEHSLKVNEKKWKMTGHPDMFWRKQKKDKFVRIIEMKTITGDMFPNLKHPLIDHVWQTEAYMWGCARDKTLPVPVDDEVGYVLYVSKKEHPKLFPMKMFPVEKDLNLRQRIRDKLRLYTKGLVDYPKNVPPLHRDCEKNNGCYRANTCAVKKECMKLVDYGG